MELQVTRVEIAPMTDEQRKKLDQWTIEPVQDIECIIPESFIEELAEALANMPDIVGGLEDLLSI